MLKKIFIPLVLALVIILNLWLGLTRIGKYSAVDEPYWTYGRTSKFWTAIAQHKWKSTDINDKPGITVAILSGAGLFKYDPMQFKSLREHTKTDNQLATINDINFYFRLPIFLFALAMLPLFYFFLKKLFNKTIAMLGLVFIGLSPILLGISMIINPDSLLWIFLPLSLISYLIFQKEKNKHYLWIAGIFLGLSLLTKYVANILYIFFFIFPFLEYIFADKKPDLTSYLKKAFLDYAIVVLISMVTFFVLYPAAWVNLNILLKGTFLSKAFKTTWPLFAGTIAMVLLDLILFKNKFTNKILLFISKNKLIITRLLSAVFVSIVGFVLINTYLGMRFFDFESILSSPKGIGSSSLFTSYFGAISADMYSLIFGLHPLILFFFIFSLLALFSKKLSFNEETRTIIYFSFFILFYYLASSVNDVAATVRYQIALYPLALIMAAIGAKFVFEIVASKIKSKTNLITIISFTALLACLISSLLLIRPFYFAYASSLLPQKYMLNLKDMGDGSFETAQYLNSLPNAQNLTIWSDKGAVCAVFKGECVISFKKEDLKNITFDYAVVSSGRAGRSLKRAPDLNNLINFKEIYNPLVQTDFKVTIGERENNYAKVVPLKNFKQE